jgi:glycosyltransferase involved in cell wall biosynthesis
MADERLRVVALEHDGNLSRVRNAGVAAGTGAWVAFLDSDDLWLPRKLELQLAALQSGGARWCYANFGHVDAAGTPIPAHAGGFRAEHGPILEALLREETAAYVGTLLVERQLLDEVGGFDESLRLRGDLDLALRLAAKADAVAVADTVTLVRVHAGRVTTHVTDPHEATARVFRRCLARERDPEIRALARARHARVLADGVGYRLRRREILPALRLLPQAIKARLIR